MKYCIQCGRQLDEASRFCTNCGTNNPEAQAEVQSVPQSEFQQEAQPLPQPEFQQQYQPPPVAPAADYTQQQYDYNNSYNNPTLPGPGSGRATASLVLGIIGIVVGEWLFGVIGLILASSSDKKQAEAGLPPIETTKAGRITSIIAIVIGVLWAIVMIAIFVPFIIGGVPDGWYI
jgi:hypothetical protein